MHHMLRRPGHTPPLTPRRYPRPHTRPAAPCARPPPLPRSPRARHGMMLVAVLVGVRWGPVARTRSPARWASSRSHGEGRGVRGGVRGVRPTGASSRATTSSAPTASSSPPPPPPAARPPRCPLPAHPHAAGVERRRGATAWRAHRELELEPSARAARPSGAHALISRLPPLLSSPQRRAARARGARVSPAPPPRRRPRPCPSPLPQALRLRLPRRDFDGGGGGAGSRSGPSTCPRRAPPAHTAGPRSRSPPPPPPPPPLSIRRGPRPRGAGDGDAAVRRQEFVVPAAHSAPGPAPSSAPAWSRCRPRPLRGPALAAAASPSRSQGGLPGVALPRPATLLAAVRLLLPLTVRRRSHAPAPAVNKPPSLPPAGGAGLGAAGDVSWSIPLLSSSAAASNGASAVVGLWGSSGLAGGRSGSAGSGSSAGSAGAAGGDMGWSIPSLGTAAVAPGPARCAPPQTRRAR